jgi:hypothetical protein
MAPKGKGRSYKISPKMSLRMAVMIPVPAIPVRNTKTAVLKKASLF